ncbi:MAG: hypothetical protein ACFHXK_16795 [bacterium]
MSLFQQAARTLVLQSFHEDGVSAWVQTCQQSVMAWCRLQGYRYRFEGDQLFDRLPRWYWQKVGDRKAIAADLARLLWVSEELASGAYDVVAWVDIDVFVMDPQQLQIAPRSSCVFGYEHWLQPKTQAVQSAVGLAGPQHFTVRKNVHNAFCAFKPDCPVLAFLIEAILRMVQRVDVDFLAPQFVGPKLLSSLHNIVGFELEPRVGAISPALRAALLQKDDVLVSKGMPQPLLAANLCASLASSPGEMNQLLHTLTPLSKSAPI